MPLTEKRDPHQLVIHLSTPKCPITLTEYVQSVFVSPDGTERHEVGPAVPDHREVSPEEAATYASFLDASVFQAVKQAQESHCKACDEKAAKDAETARADKLAEELTEKSKLLVEKDAIIAEKNAIITKKNEAAPKE